MMRAKVRVVSVETFGDSERLNFMAVCSSGFGPNGESEDNTYARWTPSGNITLSVTNPDLFGKFEPDQKFYVDFTPAE